MAVLELLIKRKNGTKVTIDGSTYHFKDIGNGKHVAEVTKQEHIKKLLAIPQYKIEEDQVIDDEPSNDENNIVDGFEDDDVITINDDELDAVDEEPEEQPKPVAKKTTARKTASK
jgi:hypothetical protein